MERFPNPASRAGRFVLSGVLVCLALVTWSASAADGVLRSALDRRVGEARRIAPAIGVHVVDLSTGEEVYSFRADTQRIIASNTKLITSAAALDVLGPGYLFETPVLLSGRGRGSVWNGDLAVIGGGDPNISGRQHDGDSLAVMRRWAQDLAARGISRIEGNLILVHGFFDGDTVHPDWPRDQLTRWYEAPVSALSFNDNCVLVRVEPGRPGQSPRVRTVPDFDLFAVRNRAWTSTSRKKHSVGIGRLLGTNTLTVSGAAYTRAAAVEAWVAVDDPVEYFGAALRKALTDEGISVSGAVVSTPTLPTGEWQRFSVHRSDLLTALEVINKRSQNFFAESVLKTLAAEHCGEGSWEAGRRVLSDFLARVGIARGEYQIADGSGLSRNNRFTPRQLTTLLSYMWVHRAAREFLLTLPHSGEEGLSWEDRLSDVPYRGNVFAKTGSLNGVSTLSGYAKGASGRLYVFSILCNQTRSNWEAKRAQDRILRALIDHG